MSSSGNQDEKHSIYLRVAREWNEIGVNYAYYSLPPSKDRLVRDADIWVDPNSYQQALHAAVSVLRDCGFEVMKPPTPWPTARGWIFGFSGTQIIEFDFMRRMVYGPSMLADGTRGLYALGDFKVDAWGCFSKRVLVRVLGGVELKEPWIVDEEIGPVRAELSKVLGAEYADRFILALESRDGDWISSERPSIKHRYMRHAFTRGLFDIPRMAMMWAQKSIAPLFITTCPTIAVVGPDGSGKSSLLDAFCASPKSIYSGTYRRHLSPRFLPKLGEALRQRPHSASAGRGPELPNRKPGSRFAHPVRLLYYALDWILGRIFKDRHPSNFMKLILYDRCYLDMAVDPFRFRLKDKIGVETIWSWMPKPDIVVYLSTSPDEAHRRKPELTVEEIGVQQKGWRRQLINGNVNAVIPSDSEPGVLSGRLEALATQAFIYKHKKYRFPTRPDDLSRHWDIAADIRFQPVARNNEIPTHRSVNLYKEKYFLLPEADPEALSCARAMVIEHRSRSVGASYRRASPRFGVGSAVSKDHRFILRNSRDSAVLKNISELFGWGSGKIFTFEANLARTRAEASIWIHGNHGQIASLVKVGWDADTVQMIERECRTLKWLSSKNFKKWNHYHASDVKSVNSRSCLCLSPPVGGSGGKVLLDDRGVYGPLLDIAEWTATDVRLISSGYWNRLAEDANKISDPYWTKLAADAVRYVEFRLSNSDVAVGLLHGDYIPSNLTTVDQQLCLTNWGDSEMNGPLVMDWIHWHYQSSMDANKNRAERALQGILRNLAINRSYGRFKKRFGMSSQADHDWIVLYLLKRLIQESRHGIVSAPDLFPLAQMLSILIYGYEGEPNELS